MFDFTLSLSLREKKHSKTLEQQFNGEPWNERGLSLEKKSISGNYFRCTWLRRPNSCPTDYHYSAEKHFFLFNEMWLRWDANTEEVPMGRLGADHATLLYSVYGVDFVKKVKGNYQLIIVDDNTGRCELFTCRIAISSTYYFLSDNEFIISSSQSELLKLVTPFPEFDPAGLIEATLFNFPMFERTYFKNICRTQQSSYYYFDEQYKFKQKEYWDCRTLYQQKLLDKDAALEKGATLFHKTVNYLASDREKIVASFTSGFDSRVIHATLDTKRENIMSFAFGMPGSMNVEIPSKICHELNYPNTPVYLDKEYVDRFEEFAFKTMRLTDGQVIQRANYNFSFSKVKDFAGAVLTGLFGSEYLRTFQNLGTVVSEQFYSANISSDPVAEIERIVRSSKESSLLNSDLYEQGISDVIEDYRKWFEFAKDFSSDHRIFLYFITEVDRKYFSNEIASERMYATTRFPFLDDEYFEFLFTAPFSGVYTKAVKPTIENRFSSQYFYAYIIKKYRPELIGYYTDHGFPPSDLMKSFSYLRVGIKHVLVKIWKQLTKYSEYNSGSLVLKLHKKHLFTQEPDYSLFSKNFRNGFENGAFERDVEVFNKMAALKYWLQEIKN